MKNKSVISVVWIVFAVMAIVFSISLFIFETFFRYDIIATVTDKNIKRYDDDDKYLVFAKDADGNAVVMKVEDNWLAGQFASSNIYAEIETGKSYTFTVGGFRIPLISEYPNIYSVTELIVE